MRAGLLQLIPHAHTGRLREHHHTSYAGLFALVVLAVVALTAISTGAGAAVPAVNPQSGSVGLSGVVQGPAPSQAAVITSPRSGQQTTSTPITVAGTCPANTFIQIMRNDVFGGAVTCGEDGTFSLQVDLFDGQNTLVARVSDALGQFGPDSAAVSVFYDSPSLSFPGTNIGRQLFLETTSTVQAVSPGQSLKRTVTIVGGTGPYAVSWDWGDGETSLVSQAAEGQTSASHTYERPGNYRVIIRVTDALNNAAFLQVVTVVNGPVEPMGASNGTGPGALSGILMIAWPIILLVGLMVLVFWLGERFERRRMQREERLSRGFV